MAVWGDVKNTGVVVFVIDTSLAMAGSKLQSAKDGVIGAIDQMHERNLVGLVTFSNSVHQKIVPAPLAQNRFALADAIRQAQASSGSDLFDAIAQGINMAATARTRKIDPWCCGSCRADRLFPASLSDLVKMAAGGKQIRICRGFEGETQCTDEDGRSVTGARSQEYRPPPMPRRPSKYISLGSV